MWRLRIGLEPYNRILLGLDRDPHPSLECKGRSCDTSNSSFVCIEWDSFHKPQVELSVKWNKWDHRLPQAKVKSISLFSGFSDPDPAPYSSPNISDFLSKIISSLPVHAAPFLENPTSLSLMVNWVKETGQNQ